MKLSKKNAALQRAMQKAIASGKALGGLLVGITAATVVGGCKEPSPASTTASGESFPSHHVVWVW